MRLLKAFGKAFGSISLLGIIAVLLVRWIMFIADTFKFGSIVGLALVFAPILLIGIVGLTYLNYIYDQPRR